MNNLFLITGPAGVGKSTISQLIADSLNKSILIEGDDIYHLVKGGYVSPWLEGNHLDIFWKNVISLIDNSLKNGYDVVFNYIIPKDRAERLARQFSFAKVKFIALLVDEETIIKRDKLRPVDSQMGERSIVLLKNALKENYNQNNILYTTNLNEKQTFNEIMNNDRFVLNQTQKYIGKVVDVKIDRPLGTKHPKHNIYYGVNYGYIPNTISGDGEELDAYVLGEYVPLENFKGKVIAVIHRLDDNDDKLIVCAEDKYFNDDEIRALTNFQERFFNSVILR